MLKRALPRQARLGPHLFIVFVHLACAIVTTLIPGTASLPSPLVRRLLAQHASFTSSSRPSIPQTYKRKMAARAFVVFRDEPSKPISAAVKSDVSIPPSSLLVQPAILVLSPGTPLTTAEKENLHPSTGARSGVIADPQSKKRKNGVLATKLHILPTVKKQRDAALDGRKRKTTSTSSSSKSSKVTTSGAPELPKVEEAVEPEPCNQGKVTQAEVDSRCYDLTVSPLADVSHAFDQVSLSPTEPRPDDTRVRSPKVGSRLSQPTGV